MLQNLAHPKPAHNLGQVLNYLELLAQKVLMLCRCSEGSRVEYFGVQDSCHDLLACNMGAGLKGGARWNTGLHLAIVCLAALGRVLTPSHKNPKA